MCEQVVDELVDVRWLVSCLAEGLTSRGNVYLSLSADDPNLLGNTALPRQQKAATSVKEDEVQSSNQSWTF